MKHEDRRRDVTALALPLKHQPHTCPVLQSTTAETNPVGQVWNARILRKSLLSLDGDSTSDAEWISRRPLQGHPTTLNETTQQMPHKRPRMARCLYTRPMILQGPQARRTNSRAQFRHGEVSFIHPASFSSSLITLRQTSTSPSLSQS